jgi:hypothetical protein
MRNAVHDVDSALGYLYPMVAGNFAEVSEVHVASYSELLGPYYTFIFSSFNIYFNVILLSASRSPQWSLSFMFFH